MPIKVACIQMCASSDAEQNIPVAVDLIKSAAMQGATLICTPEMTNLIERNKSRLLENTHFENQDSSLAHFRQLARQLQIKLLIGSLAIKLNEHHCVNRSYLINEQGDIRAYYDKIHLFDVDLPNGRRYRESSVYMKGEQAIAVAEEDFCLGLSICYDLRFPHLYRTLAKAGANIMTVPAAFTKLTGQAHWLSLLRARAIENGSYILAPAQCGIHDDGSESYGHSAIISPWGEVLAQASSDRPEYISATLDIKQTTDVRNRIPSLNADVNFDAPTTN